MNDEIAKRVYRDVQALARSDYGGNTGALLVVYGSWAASSADSSGSD